VDRLLPRLDAPGTGLGARRHLPPTSALAPLFPNGLPEGATCAVRGSGATGLALGLATELARDELLAAIGLPDLGLVAAAEAGICLDRLALCPSPGRAWPEAAALALEGCALVLLAAPTACTTTVARRLSTRAQERRALLVLLHSPVAPAWSWPMSPDIVIEVSATAWHGTASGPGRLTERVAHVRTRGRRAEPERETVLLLPDRTGHLASGESVPVSVGAAPVLAAARAS
jgi:hypothetical protein